MLVLDLLYLLAFLLISPILVYRMIRHNRYRKGWANRFGKIARRDTSKKCIWIHAVSVGEVNATRTIVKELENRLSDFEIVMSTTTDTGFARASELFADKHTVFYFPLDFSWIMLRAFCKLKPSICLLMELEVWPHFVQIAHKLRVPVVIVNGRISDKSFSRYKLIKPIIKRIFKNITIILSQTAQYAQRFQMIGAPEEKIQVAGSLKYDTAQIVDRVEGSDTLSSQLDIGTETLWVAGATGQDEEKILLDVYKELKKQQQFSEIRLVIVPRKPERFEEVGQLIQQAGFGVVRYSQIKNRTTPEQVDRQAVILGDTMGDLRKFYSLANIIFVGRTLVPMGGSDMAEAAALAKCTIFGPYAFNFKQTVDALLEDNGAIMVKDRNDLLQTIQKCLSQPDFADQIAKNGRNVIKKNQGATQKTIEQIEKLLNTG